MAAIPTVMWIMVIMLFVSSLCARGHQVTILARTYTHAQSQHAPTFITCTIDTRSLANCSRDPDAVAEPIAEHVEVIIDVVADEHEPAENATTHHSRKYK